MKKSSRPAARKPARARRKPIPRRPRAGVQSQGRRAAAQKTNQPSPAHLKRLYLDRFTVEFPTTLKVMKAYPSGQDAFLPHDRSRSALKLVHTFSVENTVALSAVRGTWTMPPAFPPPPATLTEAVAAYERGGRDLIEAVRAMPDARLHDTVVFFTGPKQMGEVPVIEVLWFMLMDSIHHRGQLSVYLRMAGGRVPSIYGPSADEEWS